MSFTVRDVRSFSRSSPKGNFTSLALRSLDTVIPKVLLLLLCHFALLLVLSSLVLSNLSSLNSKYPHSVEFLTESLVNSI
ncbi:hypothetical protein ZOSMA_27G00350 [Zostera marina]|uniref:Uncharacterized protein n=1 Tax=Zostera marina TaxID=29655 RepID=A0A0K9PD43_ZOSMR|nr:hypothetical protein ZOSMA_27G00350 [Zostera marina]